MTSKSSVGVTLLLIHRLFLWTSDMQSLVPIQVCFSTTTSRFSLRLCCTVPAAGSFSLSRVCQCSRRPEKKHKLMPNWCLIGRVARSQIPQVIVAFAFNFVYFFLLLLNIIDPQNKVILFYSMLNSKLANLEILCAEPPLYWHIYVFISNFSPLYILRYFGKSPHLHWAFQVRANCTLDRDALSTHVCLVVM